MVARELHKVLVIEKGLVHGLKLIRRDSRKNIKQAVKNIGFFVGGGAYYRYAEGNGIWSYKYACTCCE